MAIVWVDKKSGLRLPDTFQNRASCPDGYAASLDEETGVLKPLLQTVQPIPPLRKPDIEPNLRAAEEEIAELQAERDRAKQDASWWRQRADELLGLLDQSTVRISTPSIKRGDAEDGGPVGAVYPMDAAVRGPHLGWMRPLWPALKRFLSPMGIGMVWLIGILNIFWLEMRTLPEMPFAEHVPYDALPDWPWKTMTAAAITGFYATWAYMQSKVCDKS